MITVATILAFIALTCAVAYWISPPDRRRVAFAQMLIGWATLLPILMLIHELHAFTGGGDDEGYFELATIRFGSSTQLLDLTSFSGLATQPGYPWLLSAVGHLTNTDLLLFKALNLMMFLLIVAIWSRIGDLVDSSSFGRKLGWALLCMSPLWYYSFFLLKDITIVLLQSIFVLGVIGVLAGRGLRPWVLIILSTLAVIPFRLPVVLVNAAVLVGVALLNMLRRGNIRHAIATALISVLAVWFGARMLTNSDFLASMGIVAASQVLGPDMLESAQAFAQASSMNRMIFPALYLFGETGGLNPDVWVDFEPKGLRAILAVPWILIGVPFFILGVFWLVGVENNAHLRGASRLSRRFITRPWGGVLMLVAVYLAVSWQVGDTTRWRLSDLPAMASIALAGWLYGSRRFRAVVMMTWILFIGSTFSLIYLVRTL